MNHLQAVRLARAICFAIGLVLLVPLAVSAQGGFYYTFNSPGILRQAPSASQSSSPYLWLASGAELIIQNGVGETVQGALSATDPLRIQNALTQAVTTDNGSHPQNSFLMFAKTPVTDASAEVYVNRGADHVTNLANSHPYNGESLLARYLSPQNYYYAGIRADGNVVIKKKTGGAYQTLAEAKLFPGTYNASTNPDLIPKNEWVGLRLDVEDTASGAPELSLYTDVGKTGSWELALKVLDDPAKFGPPISSPGLVGIESDFADAEFDNFRVTDTRATVAAPEAAPSYDATVLADNPALYLPMNSFSSGVEKDTSGNGLNGTYKGGTPSAATLPDGEKAADFNGSSEYLSVPSSPSLSIPETGKLTYEAWIRPDTLSFANDSGDGYVDWMGKCENYSPNCEWEARMYGDSTPQGRTDRLSAYVFNPGAGLGSAADWQPDAGVITAGKWLHVVAEYDTTTTPSGCSSSAPGSINIWVDGVEQSFASHAPTGCMSQYGIIPKAGDSPLTIGTMALDTWFKGAIGKVAVYDRLLTPAEIADHFTAMTGKAPSGLCGATCTAVVP